MNRRALLPRLAAVALALAPALHCGPKESIVAVGEGKKLSADEIDADPLALLPGGAVALGFADASALLSSSMGPHALRVAQNLVPLTPEMNFEPKRDLKKIYGAGYSMQSADFALIAQGTFDPEAIKKAADKGAISTLGKPLQKTSYGGNDLYLTGDVGFSILTPKTALLGNPAGLRRALDRLRDARVKREIPDWASDLFKTPSAEVAFALDTTGQSIASAVSQNAPFVQRLNKSRILGDFKDPGLNLAGSLTYEDPQAATAGNDNLRSIASSASLLSLLPFMSSPLRTLQTNQQDKDIQFVAQIDGAALGGLLSSFSSMLGSAAATSSATPAPRATP